VESIGRVDRGVWLIDSGVPYHITPHMEWFYEYEKYDGGDVFLGDDLTTKIMGCRRVNLLLKYGRIRTLPRVLHDPKIARSLIYLRKLDDASVDNILGKDTYKMLQGYMVLMRGVLYGTLYKLLELNYTNGCNSYVVPKKINKEDKENIVPGKKTILWHQRLGNIGERGLRTLHGKGMVKGMSICARNFYFCEHYIYGKKTIKIPI